MEVTEVRIRLVQDNNAEKLCAFATITLDNEFVVRDMKVIDGNNGLFVAMPSRKVMERCRKCGSKNPIRASFCNDCGARIQVSRRFSNADGRMKVHVDVAHPVTSSCREVIHNAVVKAYKDACDRAGSGEEDNYDSTPFESQKAAEKSSSSEAQDSPADNEPAKEAEARMDDSSQGSGDKGWQIFS